MRCGEPARAGDACSRRTLPDKLAVAQRERSTLYLVLPNNKPAWQEVVADCGRCRCKVSEGLVRDTESTSERSSELFDQIHDTPLHLLATFPLLHPCLPWQRER